MRTRRIVPSGYNCIDYIDGYNRLHNIVEYSVVSAFFYKRLLGHKTHVVYDYSRIVKQDYTYNIFANNIPYAIIFSEVL